jgi:hypothetical protein
MQRQEQCTRLQESTHSIFNLDRFNTTTAFCFLAASGPTRFASYKTNTSQKGCQRKMVAKIESSGCNKAEPNDEPFVVRAACNYCKTQARAVRGAHRLQLLQNDGNEPAPPLASKEQHGHETLAPASATLSFSFSRSVRSSARRLRSSANLRV